jgi:X-X-X-Leu-X-X-Gly heptad repeat protein
MSNIVEYVLNLKDNLSPALNDATTHTKELEKALGGIKTAALEIGAALGTSLSKFKGLEHLKAGEQNVHKLQSATGQLDDGIQKIANGAKQAAKNLQFKSADQALKKIATGAKGASKAVQSIKGDAALQNLSNGAKQVAKNLQFKNADQTFKKIATGAQEASEALKSIKGDVPLQKIANGAKDISKALLPTKKNIMGLHSPLEMVGKKADGMMAKISKNTGHFATIASDVKEKLLSVKTAEGDVGDEAQLAFDQTPLAGFMKKVEDVKSKVDEAKSKLGGLTSQLSDKLAPAFNLVKDAQDAAATAQGLLTIAQDAYSFAGTAATVVTWAFSAALWSTGIPEIVLAVAALVLGIIKLSDHFGGLGNMVKGVWGVIKAFGIEVGGIFKGLGEQIWGIITFNPALIAKGAQDVSDARANGAKAVSEAWNNSDAQKAAADKAAEGKSVSVVPTGKPGAKGAAGQDAPAPKTKAEGAKTINIHINYKKPLIENFTISTVNLKQGLGSVKDMLEKILEEAIHESTLTAVV